MPLLDPCIKALRSGNYFKLSEFVRLIRKKYNDLKGSTLDPDEFNSVLIYELSLTDIRREDCAMLTAFYTGVDHFGFSNDRLAMDLMTFANSVAFALQVKSSTAVPYDPIETQAAYQQFRKGHSRFLQQLESVSASLTEELSLGVLLNTDPALEEQIKRKTVKHTGLASTFKLMEGMALERRLTHAVRDYQMYLLNRLEAYGYDTEAHAFTAPPKEFERALLKRYARIDALHTRMTERTHSKGLPLDLEDIRQEITLCTMEKPDPKERGLLQAIVDILCDALNRESIFGHKHSKLFESQTKLRAMVLAAEQIDPRAGDKDKDGPEIEMYGRRW